MEQRLKKGSSHHGLRWIPKAFIQKLSRDGAGPKCPAGYSEWTICYTAQSRPSSQHREEKGRRHLNSAPGWEEESIFKLKL